MAYRSAGAILLAAILCACAGSYAAADEAPPKIYKWVDRNGIAHYTTDPQRIPQALRRDARALSRSAAGAGPSAPDDSWAVRDAVPRRGTPPADGSPAPLDPALLAELAALEEEISSVEAEILRDEERIKTWVSDPAVDPVAIADDPEFREIAARLPRLQANLQSLQQQKRRIEEP
jgi:hypothetical protein